MADTRDFPFSNISHYLNSYTLDASGQRTQHVVLRNDQQTTMSQVIETDQNLTLYPNSGEAVKAVSRKSLHRSDDLSCWYMFADWRFAWVRAAFRVVLFPVMAFRSVWGLFEDARDVYQAERVEREGLQK